MRPNVLAIARAAAEAFESSGAVYEFGAYLVEGQGGLGDLRGLFRGRKFIGCDIRPGPGVDRVEDLANLSLPDESATMIVCLDTLEHVFEARRAVEEMTRVLAPGGVLLLSAPMNFKIHDYPSDYWRLTPACLERLLAPLAATIIGWQGVASFPHTVFAVGQKAPVDAGFASQARRFTTAVAAWLADQEANRPWTTKLKQALLGPLRTKGERRAQRDFHAVGFSLNLPTRVSAGEPKPSAAQRDPFVGSRLDLV